MNKGDLVDAIAAKAEVTKKDAERVLTAVLDEIMDAVAGGDKVTLVGFGTFEQLHKQGRQGRNPRTGEELTIPAMTVPKFNPGKVFKEMVG